jgi:hypothetical protein
MSEAAYLAPAIVSGEFAIAGGLIAIAGTLIAEALRRRADRISLSQAIVGEISALVEIVRRRHYIEDLTALVQRRNAEGNLASGGWFRFSARGNYFAVYQANLVRVGMLRDPKPGLVAQYYTQASSILEDIKDIDEGKFSSLTPNEATRGLEELLGLFKDTDDLGRKLSGLPPRS